MPDGGAVFLRAAAGAIRPRPPRTVSQWADSERYVSQRSSSAWGKWRTDRVPFAREPMDELSADSPAQEVIFVAGVQVTKTEIGLNWIGYSAQEDPGPLLVVYPTVEVGGRWVKQRLNPMIAESATLREIFPPERSRDSTNTASMKEFPGGLLIVGGANSPASLSSMPAGKLMADEVDRYPRDVGKDAEGGGEGDPLDLAEARLSAFPRSKSYIASSPTILSLSRIWKRWLKSSQGEYHVPCPHCMELQVLRRDNLRYPEGRPEEAKFACIHCGVLIEERFKAWMLDPANGAKWIHKYPERIKVRGFHLSAWYAAPGLGKSWGHRATQYEEVKNDPERLKVFVNTVDGLCYEDPNEKLDWEELKGRGEPVAECRVPPGYLVLTLGADLQKDRLEYQIVAWGRGMRRFVIEYGVIPCDPMRTDWHAKMDEVLDTPFRNAYGVDLKIRAAAIDSGYLPDEVFAYTRMRKGRGVFAIKGAKEAGKPVLSRPSKVDFRRNGVVHRAGAEQWQVGVDTAKHGIFAAAAGDRVIQDPDDRMLRFSAALEDEYFRGLCSEIWDPHKRRWIRIYKRNEPLDTLGYATAAAYHPSINGGIHRIKDQLWEKLEAMIEPKAGSLFARGPLVEAAAPAAAPQPAAPETPREQPEETGPLDRHDTENWID